MKYLVFVGMLISLIGIASYIKDMLKGKVKPNRITWMMWSIAPLIAAFAALSTGATLSVIPVFMTGFSPLIVFIISLFKKQAYWKIHKFDYVCGFLSALALILWYITKDPIIAIVFSIVGDFSAAIPTIVKAWKYPDTENSFAFSTGIIATLTSFAAIEVWNFASVAFPLYIILMDMFIVFSIERVRFVKTQKRGDKNV